MSPDSWGMIVGLTSLISTLALGSLAIALSVYFFVKTKQTEGIVGSALAAVKQQTDSLQKLAAKQMDRLIGVVAEKPELEEQRTMIIELFKVIQRPAFTDPVPKQGELTPEMNEWLFRITIVAYFYAGMSNILAHSLLPARIADANEWVIRKVDNSYADFITLDAFLAGTNQAYLKNHPIYSWYDEALNLCKPLVRNTTGVYQAREQESRSTSATTE
jgi:hypothetical protein